MTVAGLENVEDVYPLSPMQQGMLFHTISDPASGVFVNQINTALRGELDVDAFQAAWADLVSRHAILRTIFLWDGIEEPLQVVRQQASLEWTEEDWSSLTPEERDRNISNLMAADRRRGFDLGTAPLTRMTLIRCGPESWRWVWSTHHAIVDGWSAQVLLAELRTLYDAHIRGTDPSLDPAFAYRDFIRQVSSRDEAAEEAFWRDRLKGFSEPHRLEVPGLVPSTDSSGHATHTVTLDAEATRSLEAMARHNQVTLNTAVVGAWSLLLSRWTRERDIVFGATTSGRPADLPGCERGVGLFINTLPLRIDVEAQRPLGDWLRGIQTQQVETLAHEQSSLAAVQRWSDMAPGDALFESIFVFENYPPSASRADDPGFEMAEMDYIEQSNYPLAVLAIPGHTLTVTFVYDRARLAAPAIESLGAQLTTVLSRFAEAPQQRLAAFDLLEPIEQTRLETLSSGPEIPADNRCVHQIIEAIAGERPEAIAVSFDGQELSYRDLNGAADRLAARLQAAGVGPNRPVGLYLPRSIEMIVGLLAILKAGGAYVPLDPSYPPGHIQLLLENDAIDIVLTDDAHRDGVAATIAVVLVDASEEPPGLPVRPTATASDLAYVIHTSGSTGRPKGVAVTHANLVHSTLARTLHYRQPVGRFLLMSSFAFDSSVAGIFWTLTGGGTLVLPAPDQEHDALSLLELARRQQITHTLALPSLYEILLENSADGQLDSLRVAIVAGEACPARLVDAHRNRLPAGELHNEYGPTEATVWCTAHRASESDQILPIGRPIAGTRILLLDDHGNLVPPGFAGEICVAGPGVVSGYLGRPDLTAERFVTAHYFGREERIYRTGDLGAWRSDGVLAYLGRRDTQLKIRGHRIEAAAVETALRSHPAISEAIALGRSAPGRPATQLVAYVGTDQDDLDVEEMKRHLSSTLPDFMVPDILVPVREIPRLPNGKVATGLLPDPRFQAQGVDDHVAPRTSRERALASIWAELLDLEEVGVRDDFFELGGDSISSIRMISRARQAGIHIVPGQITSKPTIEQLATATDGAPTVSDQPVSGPVPLGPIQQWFFEMDLPVPGHWNQSNLFAIDTRVDAGALERALQACVHSHDMLRARFVRSDGTWEQLVDGDTRATLEIADEADDVDEILAAWQGSLELDSGPMLRAVLIARPPDEPDLLFLAVHHLVIDVVSWAVLVDDLESAYLQAAKGEDIDLPRRSSSYRDWISHLTSDDLAEEQAFWRTHGVGPSQHPPRMWGTEASRQAITLELEADVTGQLLRVANDAFRTRPDELMIAALVPVLASEGDGTLRLALERHGRPSDIPGIDLSRTIGWFTAQHPLTLTTNDVDDSQLIAGTKETLRSVPNGGLGYGVLRYLQRLPELVGQPEPAYLFNYLGRAPADGGGVFRWLSAADDSSRHPSNERAYRIEIVATVRRDRLAVTWYFSSEHDDEKVVAEMAEDHLSRLRGLVSHCIVAESGILTPSDFPVAGLDQSELDQFLDGLA